ncbi:hypothetical protein BC937DRAFT_87486 [Endogone sp. FLAS-F59071]|nr:hypothetical protein BC937DRAFT_87486 [Endogone sp. FLAS-F59071]|eukprot:RUS22742.1 hypothetical protein BC937DRAFT_87486 [Endogone sp. FLAS-F59071]
MYLHLEDEHWQEINAKFKAMKKERMWKLSTGRYVEEEIYKLTKKFGHECALHSFIVDIDDMAIREHFSDTELDEIESAPTPPFPKLGDPVIECLNKFVGKTDLKAIREIIKETFQGKEYDVEKYHDIDYILFAVHALVREIESRKLDDTNLENWFNCHVWNVIVDQCFGDMVAVSIVRGESTSTAVASRKNEHRQMGEKRKIGRRGDWILRSTGNNDKCEYGAGEASRLWVDNYGTKFLREAGLKLPKMLSNMLRKLMQKANWDKESCKRMQTVGIVHSGLMMTMMYVDNPRGYIFRARRSELMEVPNVPEKFPVILIILAAVLNAKAVVCETIKALLPKEQMAISFSEAGLRKRTHEKMEPREQNEQLMACLSTPRKKRALQSK